MVGRAILPVKVGHPADHWVVLRPSQVSISFSLILAPSLPLSLARALSLPPLLAQASGSGTASGRLVS